MEKERHEMPRIPKNQTLTRSQSYNRAETLLKDRHRDEFEEILAGVYAENGHDYKPRLTPEERAQAVLEERKRKAQARIAAEVAKYGPDVLPLPESGRETTDAEIDAGVLDGK